MIFALDKWEEYGGTLLGTSFLPENQYREHILWKKIYSIDLHNKSQVIKQWLSMYFRGKTNSALPWNPCTGHSLSNR